MNRFVEEYPVVPVPRDFITAPIFASKPQTGSREVTVKGKTYTIGGFKPISYDGPVCPALDIRHGRAIFVICSFLDKNAENTKVQFSLNEFCKRYANTNGGRYSREIRAILSELAHCWIKVKEEGSKEWDTFRLLQSIRMHGRERRRKPQGNEVIQEEIWFDSVELDPVFFELMRDYVNIAKIDLKSLTSLKSPLAQAIYAYIPSRAVHSNESKPFAINLATLLLQVGHHVPVEKSVRKKIFVQNSNSIIKQLDGIAIVNGVLRVRLIETVGEGDYKLLCWAENNQEIAFRLPKAGGKLKEIWIGNGGSLNEFYIRSKNPLPELSRWHEGMLEQANIKLIGNVPFFRMALGLLGNEKFDACLVEAKTAILEKIKITTTPTQRLIHYIKEAIGVQAKLDGSSSERVEIKIMSNSVDKSEVTTKNNSNSKYLQKKHFNPIDAEEKRKLDGLKRAKIFLEIFSDEFQEFCQRPLLREDREQFVDALLNENPKISKSTANYIISNFFKVSSEKLNKYSEQTIYLW